MDHLNNLLSAPWPSSGLLTSASRAVHHGTSPRASLASSSATTKKGMCECGDEVPLRNMIY
eukprot:3428283-Prorocentrum_lima.AAC.1